MLCSNCGRDIPNGQLICPHCGAEVRLVPDYSTVGDMLSQKENSRKNQEQKRKSGSGKKKAGEGKHINPFALTIIFVFALIIFALALKLAIDYRNQGDYDLQLEMAQYNFSEKEYAKAEKYANQAITLEPTRSEPRLLLAESDLEKLWSLLVKYLSMAEDFGPELTGAMFSLELAGKFSLTDAVNEYMDRYREWFLRYVKSCQTAGIIQNQGQPQELIPLGVKLTFFIVYEWSVSGGSFPLRERAFAAMENLYDIAPTYRGIRP